MYIHFCLILIPVTLYLHSVPKEVLFYLGKQIYMPFINIHSKSKRKSEQAHIPHAPTLLENEWQFQALGTGNRTKKGI